MKVFCHIAGDEDLLEAWLDHYQSLGATAFYFIVHGPPSENRLLLSGLPGRPIHLVRHYEGPMWEMAKIAWLNRAIASARGEWITVVDSDEFLELPFDDFAQTIEALRRCGSLVLGAPLLQRVPPGGDLAALPDGAIADPFSQFPLAVPDLCARMGAKPQLAKFPLFFNREDAQVTLGCHTLPVRGARQVNAFQGISHHFKWRRNLIQRMNRREIDTFYWSKQEYTIYQRYLDENRHHLPLDGAFVCDRAALWARGLLRRPAQPYLEQAGGTATWHVVSGEDLQWQPLISRAIAEERARGIDARLLLLIRPGHNPPSPSDPWSAAAPVLRVLTIPPCNPLQYDVELDIVEQMREPLFDRGADWVHVYGENPAWLALFAAADQTETRLTLTVHPHPSAMWGWLLPAIKDLPDQIRFTTTGQAHGLIDQIALNPASVFITGEDASLMGSAFDRTGDGESIEARRSRRAQALADYRQARVRQLQEHLNKVQFLRNRPAPGRTSGTAAKPNYFVMLGSARVGSNYLRSLLGSHSQVRVFGEILDLRERKGAFPERWMERRHARAIAASAYEWLRTTWFEGCFECPGIAAIGFKLFYHQVEERREHRIWMLLKEKRVSIIHLTRNLYHKYISEQLALRSGCWLVQDQREITPEEPLTIDPLHLEKYFRHLERNQRLLEQFFNDQPVLNWSYEAMIAHPDPSGVLSSFLGIPREPLQAKTLKQHPSPPESYVTNHHEVRRYFSQTAYARFFEIG